MVPERSVGPVHLVRVAFVFFVVVVMQLVVSNNFRIWGVSADLFLVAAALFGLSGGPNLGVWFGFFLGILADALFRSTPFGLSALELCVIGYATGMIRAALVRSGFLIGPLTVYVCSFLGLLVMATAAALFGLGQIFQDGYLPVFIVFPLINATAAIAFTPLIRWSVEEPQAQLSLVR